MSHVCAARKKVACMMYNMKVFALFTVKKIMVHAFAYRVLRYGVTIHAFYTASWRMKIDSIL